MYFAFALSISLTHCNKTTVDPNGLPPETQTGAGTFACKINGVVWKYKDPDPKWLSTNPKTRWSFDPNRLSGFLEIYGWKYSDGKNSDDYLVLAADSLLLFKEKAIRHFFANYGVSFTNFLAKKGECANFNSSGVNDTTKNFNSSGKLIISRLDQNAKIISGTFSCDIYQSGCGDTLKITDGRFDIKYQ